MDQVPANSEKCVCVLLAAYLPHNAQQACGAPGVGFRGDTKARPHHHQQTHKEVGGGM